MSDLRAQASSLLPQVANWLYNVVEAQYVHKKLVYTHVYQFLQVHLKRGLQFRIRTKVHTSSSTGHSQLLINLFATIQLNAQTCAPVEIWVPLNYPYVEHASHTVELNGVPLMYVTPDHSKGLYLNVNNHIDSQGRVYHPYFTDWFNNCTQSELYKFNLVTMVGVIHNQFLKESPITIREDNSIQMILSRLQSQSLYDSTSPRGNNMLPQSSEMSSTMPPQSTGMAPPLPSQSTGMAPPLPPQSTGMAPPLPPQSTGMAPPLPPQSTGVSAASVPQYTGEYNPIGRPIDGLRSAGTLDAPQLPPKIQKNQAMVDQGTAPQPPSIPLKYQSPLPLPGEGGQTQVTTNQALPVSQSSPMGYPQHIDQPPLHFPQYATPPPQVPYPNSPLTQSSQSQSPYTRTPNVQSPHVAAAQIDASYGSQIQSPNRKTPQLQSPVTKSPPAEQVQNVDLMDQEITPSNTVTTLRADLLQTLSDNINLFLQNDVHNKIIPQINANEAKVNALCTQLQLHLDLAKANLQNLHDHKMALEHLIGSLGTLNALLQKLDALNAEHFDRVFTAEGHSILLDEIIIPDLPLVKQLYDVVLETKATKDAISLIGGDFASEKEIINDDRVDACVKTVRNLGRELFWLELVKNEALNRS